jgi:hypothetical protein
MKGQVNWEGTCQISNGPKNHMREFGFSLRPKGSHWRRVTLWSPDLRMYASYKGRGQGQGGYFTHWSISSEWLQCEPILHTAVRLLVEHNCITVLAQEVEGGAASSLPPLGSNSVMIHG